MNVYIATEHAESLIWTSDGRDRDDCCTVGCGALQLDRCLSTFWRTSLPPSSG